MTRTAATDIYPELATKHHSELTADESFLMNAAMRLSMLERNVATARANVESELRSALPSATFAVDAMADYVARATVLNELQTMFTGAAAQGMTVEALVEGIKTHVLMGIKFTGDQTLREERIRLADNLGLLGRAF